MKYVNTVEWNRQDGSDTLSFSFHISQILVRRLGA